MLISVENSSASGHKKILPQAFHTFTFFPFPFALFIVPDILSYENPYSLLFLHSIFLILHSPVFLHSYIPVFLNLDPKGRDRTFSANTILLFFKNLKIFISLHSISLHHFATRIIQIFRPKNAICRVIRRACFARPWERGRLARFPRRAKSVFDK